MNDYFNTLQNINQSSDRLLKDEHNSLEIKQAATSLRQAVEPCIEELKQSATRLQRLVLGCTKDLLHAENVWISKQRVMEAANCEIWKQIGEMSGRSIKIRQLGVQCKDKTLEQAKQFLEPRIEWLRNKCFIDAKGHQKKGIGWDDKKVFVNAINPILNRQCEEVERMIEENLSAVYQEVINIQSKPFQHCISLLDQQTQIKLSKQINLLASELQTKFSHPVEHKPHHLLGLKAAISSDLKALVDRGWDDIYWEEVTKFKNNVLVKIDVFVTVIVNDRVELADAAFTKAIAFYNDFLEQQQRYQQETPEQREAENAWIERQRQELVRIQNGIEVLLNC